MKKIYFAVFIGLLFQACSQKIGANLIANTQWILAEWPGRTIPANGTATLNFDNTGKIGGKSFCNSYGGSSEINNGTVKFGQLFSTKMFCTDLSDAENKYQADLQTVNTITMNTGRLNLLRDGKIDHGFYKC
jgi:heat shock protein HslJ